MSDHESKAARGSSLGSGASLLRSLAGLPWSMPLLGARLASSWLGPAGRPPVPLDRWPLSITGLDPRALPAELLGSSLALLRHGAATASTFGPAVSRNDLLELHAKLRVFECFRSAGRDSAPSTTLLARLAKLDHLESFASLWTLEGIGHDLAHEAWGASPRDEPLFSSELLTSMPPRRWLALHTGMGLAIAQAMLPQITDPEPETARLGLDRWYELALAHSRPGYEGAVLEALGLIMRVLEPGAVGRVDSHMSQMPPELRDHFWHGLGRGLYFAPSALLPGSTPWAFAAARREPQHDDGRHNALAGLAWAVVLVNLTQPEVVAGRLEDLEMLDAREREAFSDGVAGAVLLWHDAMGHEAVLGAFLDHRPAKRHEASWKHHVHEPCLQALEGNPDLDEEAGKSKIFRFDSRRPWRRGEGA